MPDLTAAHADPELLALRIIVEGTASGTGQVFFNALVQHLALATSMRHTFIAEFQPHGDVRTLAYWSNGALVENIEYPLKGTPCEEVLEGGLCVYRSGLQLKYPVTEAGLESYIGLPLRAPDGRVLGHLAAFDDDPLSEVPRRLTMFQIFAARAATELERLRLEANLRSQEIQLHDLFEEAPIAYVHEGKDTRFIRANRVARELLGISAEEVPQVIGRRVGTRHTGGAASPAGSHAAVGRGYGGSGSGDGIAPQRQRQGGLGPVVVQSGTRR